jgi:uncharacterized protein
MKVIDGRVRLRTPQLLKAWTTELHPAFREYIDLYGMKDRLTENPPTLTRVEMLEAGIGKAIVCGGCEEDNDSIMAMMPWVEDWVVPVGGMPIKTAQKSALESSRIIKAGMKAVSIAPFMTHHDVNHADVLPVYEMCQNARIPVIVHSSIHYWPDADMWHGSPEKFDKIARYFPNLTIIMSHGGNGFGPTVLAVAQRHKNIYLEFSALNPKYMAPEFLQAARTYLKDRCIFGSDYPLIPFSKAMNMWRNADMPEQFFGANMERALGI